MNTIWIVDLESLDNRYTKQWKTHIPQLFKEKQKDFYVSVIGDLTENDEYVAPGKGAFLDFSKSVEYKAKQAKSIARLFINGLVKAGDIFLFTDAWNQTIHSLKYLSELNNIPVVIVGIWHAGAYDPTDILGFTIKNKAWVTCFEKATYEAIDFNLFGTKSHLSKFKHGLNLLDISRNMYVTGYPFEWISEGLRNEKEKEDIIVFPHRLNSDKAPHIFDALRDIVHQTHPHIQFIKTQELGMNKDEYYEFLKKCRVVFSANKHENLGIGIFEAMAAGCLPLVPNKLSYEEMYNPFFKYAILDEELFYEGKDFKNLETIAKWLIVMMENKNAFENRRIEDVKRIQKEFFSFDDFFSTLFPMIKEASENYV